MCKEWAAVHADVNSGIWEAACLSRVTPTPSDTLRRVALEAWLARRAPGLRQLQLEDDMATEQHCFDDPTVSDHDEVRVRDWAAAASSVGLRACRRTRMDLTWSISVPIASGSDI